jgi:capsid assembly protease
MFENVLSYLTGGPLLVTPQKLAAVLHVLHGRQPLLLPQSLQPTAGTYTQNIPASRQPEYYIGVIRALGSLSARAMPGDSEVTTYRDLTQQLDRYVNDPDVSDIVFDFCSCGGMVAGCHRLVERIREAAAIKPVYAFVDHEAYSAAYWLAAACDKVILADSQCGVGSIGAICLHADVSKYDEKQGYAIHAAYFGSHKNDFNPHFSLSDDMKKQMQLIADQTGMKFAEAVAALRGLPLEKVLATEAGLFRGEDAIKLGLADEIMTWDELLEYIQTNRQAKSMAKPMTTAQRLEAGAARNQNLEEGTTMNAPMTTAQRLEAIITKNQDAPEALANLGWLPSAKVTATAEQDLAKARQEGYAAALAHVDEVLSRVELAKEVQLDTKAIGALCKMSSLDQVQATLQQKLADRSAAQIVLGARNPQGRDEEHVFLTAVKAKAAQAAGK